MMEHAGFGVMPGPKDLFDRCGIHSSAITRARSASPIRHSELKSKAAKINYQNDGKKLVIFLTDKPCMKLTSCAVNLIKTFKN